MKEYKYEEINVGLEVSFEYAITEAKMQQFFEISGDSNSLHTDLDYAKSRGYAENVVYGQLTAASLSTLAGMYIPGKYSLIHSIETHFLKPVFISECPLTVYGKVVDKDDRFKTLTIKFYIKNKKEEKVCRGVMQVGVIE